MKAIAIYVEGGGDGPGSNHNKRELRQGFDVLFQKQKQAAQAKKLGWQLMPCGSRNQSFKAFHGDLQQADEETLLVLLVDSEDPIVPEPRMPRMLTPRRAPSISPTGIRGICRRLTPSRFT